MTEKIVITDEVAGGRLDAAVAMLTDRSRSSLAKLLKQGLICVDGQTATGKQPAVAGQIVEIGMLPSPEEYEAPGLKILYEDDDLLVVDKPAGLAVHLSESGRPQPTVAAFAREYGVIDDDPDRPGIVHRLDKDTSGLLVIAKNPSAKQFLQNEFKKRQVKKTYLALISGHLKDDQATIDLPIDRSRKRPTKRAVVPGGRPSKTHYKVIEAFSGFSLLEVELETGRTHQIRVHFSHLGHPVAGDQLYGGPKLNGLDTQFLHASKLSFTSPSGKNIKVESPLPKQLKMVLESLHSKV